MKERSFAHNIPASPYNQFLIDALDIIIDRLAETYTFPKMLADINGQKHNIDLEAPGIVYRHPHFETNFKEWLEYNFVSVFRGNTLGCVPEIIKWRIGFSNLQFQLTQDAATRLFVQNFNWARHNLKQEHSQEYPFIYECYLLYDLADEKFINYM